jgi:hypothetical protein
MSGINYLAGLSKNTIKTFNRTIKLVECWGVFNCRIAPQIMLFFKPCNPTVGRQIDLYQLNP